MQTEAGPETQKYKCVISHFHHACDQIMLRIDMDIIFDPPPLIANKYIGILFSQIVLQKIAKSLSWELIKLWPKYGKKRLLKTYSAVPLISSTICIKNWKIHICIGQCLKNVTLPFLL